MGTDAVEHAKYSPSSLEQLELCACFVQDNSSSNEAAADGERLHKAAELEDLTLCHDEEEEEAVTRCLSMADQIRTAMGEDVEVLKEVELIVGEFTRGIGDLVLVKDAKAHLIDWKFGRFPVKEADDNIQMQGYVMGIFTGFPDVEEVTVTIVGPRMDFLSTATYNRSDVDRIHSRIGNVIARCEDENKTEEANEDACRFCGRKADCPRIAETALTVARNIGLPMPIEFEPGRIVRPEDRARAQVLSYILEDWASQIRKFNAQAVLEDGIEVPGFEIRSRRGATTVVDVFAVVQQVVAVYGVEIEAALQACSLSVSKLVEQVYAQKQLMKEKVTKKAVRENLLQEIAEHITEGNSVSFLQRTRGKTNEDIINECGRGRLEVEPGAE